jgi:hypothetical protein
MVSSSSLKILLNEALKAVILSELCSQAKTCTNGARNSLGA